MNKKKFKILFVALFAQVLPLLGSLDTSLEIRAAGFYPSSSRFKDIYDEVGMSYQIEGSIKLHQFVYGWFNFDRYSKKGQTLEFGNPTKVTIDNISFGVKLPYRLTEQFSPYIGIGPTFSRIRLKNKSPCPNLGGDDEYAKKWATGGILKTGVYCYLRSDLFIDIFMDYVYLPVHFEDTVDAGGLKVGIGVGAKF